MKKLTLNPMIIREFCLFTGLSEAEAAEWTPLLQGAVSHIDRRVLSRRAIENNAGLLGHTAAALAFYRYRLVADGGATVLKAGELSISRQNGLAAASAVRDEAMAAAGHLLKDDGFYFKTC